MQTVSTTTPTPIKAVSTSAFISSLGIVTDLGDEDTPYGSLYSSIASDLDYLGVTNIRASANVDLNINPSSLYGNQVLKLMASGVKFDLVVDDSHSVAYYIANFNLLEEAHPGSIVSIEGENEVPVANIPTYQAFQTQLYAAVRADPLLNNVPVAGFTLYTLDANVIASVDNDSLEDEGVTHSYSGILAPNTWQSWNLARTTTDSPGQPFIVTETGEDTDDAVPPAGQLSPGVNQDVDAKYTLDNLLDIIMDGAKTVYDSELFDLASDPGNTDNEDHFGLYNADGSPKEVAIVLHNFTTILADPGATAATFTPGTLSYSISGLNSNIPASTLEADFGYGTFISVVENSPTYGYSYLMEKSNGTFDLAVWAEPDIWDGVTSTEIQAPTIPVTVTLGTEAASVEVYDPLIGTSPIATFTDVTQVTFGVTDHPLIIEIDPFPAGTGSTSTSTTSTGTTSTGTTSTGTTSTGTTSTSTTSTISSTTTTNSSGTQVVDPAASTKSIGTVTVGSGPDTIAITVAEDAYQGNAQFVVLVNGTQIGGTQTVTAQQGLGQSEVFDIEGTFNSGTNAVSVVYINDAGGSTPMTDRNLYVLGASYDTSSNPAAAVLASSSGSAVLQDGPFSFSLSAASPSATTIGSGPDQLQLTVAEQSFYGDAQFIISVDGVQVGGVQTATATATAGESQVFDVNGTFGAGDHNVSVTLVNPYGFSGTPLAVRSLYIEGVSLDGTSGFASTANSSIDLTSGTAESFSVSHTATAPVVLGSGPDTLALFIAEDAYLGNAQFTVTVDGQQIGGTQTASELHGSGQAQEYDIQGNFAPGSHNVSVTFLNDAYGGSSSLDRNLYVDAASINGNTISGATYEINNTASMGFSFTTPGALPTVTVGGTGSDTLALNVSEDYYQGNAEFTVLIDGKQVGGVQTAAAIHGNGQSQVFDVFGSFSGTHTVSVDFLNDAYGGSTNLDRNLYVSSASVNGTTLANSSLTLNPQGTQSFTFTH